MQLLEPEIWKSSLSVSFPSTFAISNYLGLLILPLRCILNPSPFLHLHNGPSSGLWIDLSAASLQSIHYVAARVLFKVTELIMYPLVLKILH